MNVTHYVNKSMFV